jgi:ribosomal protein S18
MGISHEDASPTSKALCDSLFAQLSNLFSDLQKAERNSGTHVFAIPGRPQLTWVYHRKNLEKIEIWPYFDYKDVKELHEFVSATGLAVKPRQKYSGIARLYPLPIELHSEADVKLAIPILKFAQARMAASKSQRQRRFQRLPDELTEPQLFPEGGVRTITVNSYERNDRARNACIKHFGAACIVCGFNFERLYGELGKGYIHVHHLVDIALIGKKYKVDPKRDLRPVCPNCHAMLHTRSPALSIDALKAILISSRAVH